MSAVKASWSSHLEKISHQLIETSNNIQAAFLDYSRKSQAEAKSNNDIIPLENGADPINLLKRISILESTLVRLKDECEEFAKQRPIVAHEVTELMLENFRSIEELTVLTKGKNASIDSNLRQLAMLAHNQNEAWGCSHSSRNTANLSQSQSNINDLKKSSNHIDEIQNGSQNEIDIQQEQNHNQTSFISPSTGNITITEHQFNAIPIGKRGRSKLSRVQSVASMIYEETTARYLDGYRGRSLAIERSNLLKYAAAYPEMNNVIRDHGLWRDIVSSLEYLGFVRVDHSDGSLSMVDF